MSMMDIFLFVTESADRRLYDNISYEINGSPR